MTPAQQTLRQLNEIVSSSQPPKQSAAQAAKEALEHYIQTFGDPENG